MNRIILLAVALALAPAVSAQLYKYVDKDGKTVYSDQPPANVDSKQLRIQAGPPTAATPAKSALDKDKELEKGRKAETEKAKKGEQTAKAALEAESRCTTARENLRVAEAARRPSRLNEKGEQVYLEQSEIDALMAQRRAAVDEACKKS